MSSYDYFDLVVSFDVSHFGSGLRAHEGLIEFPSEGEASAGQQQDPSPESGDASSNQNGLVESVVVTATAEIPSASELPTSPPPPYSDDTARSSVSIAPLTRQHNVNNHLDHSDQFNRQCMVCMESREIDNFPSGKITPACYHPTLVCFRCLQFSIANDHSSKMWNNINCPQCYQKLPFESVKAFADEHTFAHYDALCTRQALSSMSNFNWCTGCDSGQIHVVGGSCPEVTCRECNTVSCFTHKVPWHKNLTCDQYDRLTRPSTLSSLIIIISKSTQTLLSCSIPTTQKRLTGIFQSKTTHSTQNTISFPTTNSSSKNTHIQEPTTTTINPITRIREQHNEQRASVKRIKQVCKNCPGCSLPIQKSDGCKHMTCFGCHAQWCWRCHKLWGNYHKCWKWWQRSHHEDFLRDDRLTTAFD